MEEEEKKTEDNTDMQNSNMPESGQIENKPDNTFERMSADVGMMGVGVIFAISCFVSDHFPMYGTEVGFIIGFPLLTVWMLYSDGAFSKKVPWNERKKMLISCPILGLGIGIWRYYAYTDPTKVWQIRLGIGIAIASFIWLLNERRKEINGKHKERH